MGPRKWLKQINQMNNRRFDLGIPLGILIEEVRETPTL